jgi:hypothetical protein
MTAVSNSEALYKDAKKVIVLGGLRTSEVGAYSRSCRPWDQVFYIAVAYCSLFGCLHHTIDAFEQTIRHLAVEPAQNAFLLQPDRLGQANHGCELIGWPSRSISRKYTSARI